MASFFPVAHAKEACFKAIIEDKKDSSAITLIRLQEVYGTKNA